MRWINGVLIGLLLLTGCKHFTEIKTEHHVQKNILPTSDVVKVEHTSIENLERLDQFVLFADQHKEDRIRLIKYTVEGHPIYFDISVTGSEIMVTIDTTEDKYGSPEVRTYPCKSIDRVITSTEISYNVKGCPNDNEIELVYVSHDVEKENFFAFQLKYGTNDVVEINTKENKLELKLNENNTVNVADFQFTNEQLNKIYKLMIDANYLNDKTLTSKCNQPNKQEYELNIWINSGFKKFSWANCDQSEDGIEMMQLADGIIEILKETNMYQSIPELD
ncbi:DUF4362 domain-containing protein [Bacillus pinisoli]|uniref:DUF4362 domain-containing protein n=1 Tax=Bacillus pinisoli TaxID=2901866 RepID=UPI001FF47606|nr:DUF4362 domain-containing protein [Bacillus pinisoli]